MSRNGHLTLLLPAILLAIGPLSAQQGDLRLMASRYKADREALREYDWSRRTEVEVNGELRETTLSRLRYEQQRLVEMPAEDPPQSRRARKSRKKTAEFIARLRELTDSYTEFTPEQMRTLFERASVFPGTGAAEGTLRVQMRSVIRKGDTFYIWADEGTKRLVKFEILTSIEGRPVNVVTEFRRLERGPTFPARITIETEMKGKPMVIRMENFDFVRRGG
jgi:hypothetical protein